jgi:hypothetical protein
MCFALFDPFYVIRILPAASPHRSDMKFLERVENTFYESKNPSRHQYVFLTSLIAGDRTLIYLSV